MIRRFTIDGIRRPGPKKNNVIEAPDREIPLPINEEQDLVAFTKHLQKNVWHEPPTRYFSLQYYMYEFDFDKELATEQLSPNVTRSYLFGYQTTNYFRF